MPRMTGNHYIAKMIEAYGITSIFQVPTAFFGVMAEMENMDIRRVVTHGEKAAAYMADGYARATKGPGICMAQSIGAANLAAGLADAFMAQSPVIAMTNAIPAEHRYRHVYQEYDHAAPLPLGHEGQLRSRQGFPHSRLPPADFSRGHHRLPRPRPSPRPRRSSLRRR